MSTFSLPENDKGQRLHVCGECKGRGKWLACNKLVQRKPTKKDPSTEVMVTRKVSVGRRGVMEHFEFTCEKVNCQFCKGSGYIPEQVRERQESFL